MSSFPVENVNAELKAKASLFEFLGQANLQEKLFELGVNWVNGEITECEATVELRNAGYLKKDGNTLTRMGILFLSRLAIDFQSQFSRGTEVQEKYTIQSVIRIGKNSATFRAKHKILSSDLVLKFIRPGASENLIKSLQVVSSAEVLGNIVRPTDYFEISVKDIFGEEVQISCIVYPFIEGETLRDFLNTNSRPINSHAIISFIMQVGEALSQLEKADAYHGDLHEENIIVTFSDAGVLKFNIIDVSYGTMGSLSSQICHDNDLTFFRQHLWKILSIQQSLLPKMSVRKLLGSRAFSVVSNVMSSKTIFFKQIVEYVNNISEHRKLADRKKIFIEEKFSPPSLFKLQRYEEITDPSVARKLFEPFPELIDKVKEFSNVFIAGNRGSGKSTYLAALAFFPKATESLISFRSKFGIYFPCRLGEFRLLSSDMYEEVSPHYQKLKHVIILKIVRRTLEILAEAVEYNKILEPIDYSPLKETLKRITGASDFLSIDKSIVSEIRNYSTSLVRIEMKEIDNLYNNTPSQDKGHHTNEMGLVNFFETLKSTFTEIANTQFYLLFDDAGQPHVPDEVQCVMNDLILGSNAIYCLKFSAEKFTYSFVSTTEKNLENGHDYFEYDISSMLFIGGKTTGLDRGNLEKYFRKIMQKRLSHFEFQSDDIADYLGNLEVKTEQLINSLATGKRNAYYCGWSVVWIIADRTPRNLIEIVAEIFSAAKINKYSPPEKIHNRTQNRAIRNLSEKRLQSLNHIAGVVTVNGQKVSLGSKLFEITTTTGSAYRIYLKDEKGKQRKRQTLAIERNDTVQISEEAGILLKKLISYGVFDAAKLDYARDDRVKKPIYVLNRIFCPAFGISPQRDNHLRLSKLKFEQLLLEPSVFLSDGTKRLRTEQANTPIIKDLFGDINGN